jgi:hypothetical protein
MLMTFDMVEKAIVRLKIKSITRSPEEITEMLGIQSDFSWHRGDKRAHTIILEKDNGWVLGSSLPDSDSLEQHINSLLARISACSNKIKLLSEDESLELSCVLYASEMPALNFSREVIHSICSIGASLDVDVYIVGQE